MNTVVSFELDYLLLKKDIPMPIEPTIAHVVMWIHKEKGLWINVMYMGFELKYSWSIDIITTSGSNWDSYGEEGDVYYNSPTEAYEAAIKYTLNNLIS